MTASPFKSKLGKIGVWSMELRFGAADQKAETAAELEQLGYSAIWIPGGIGGDITGDVAALVAATKSCVIGTGIINIWKHEPAEISAWWKAQPQATQARVLLGLGISHGPLIGEGYGKPVATMREYISKLRADGVPASSLCLAALGPKMLELSRDQTAGAHPYLVTPEHTKAARDVLGPEALLAPEQGVILETDPSKAREIARNALSTYTRLPNYANNWKRYGLTDDDIDQVSDRLVDAMFAWGDAKTIAPRVRAHLDAGADHVCIQLVKGMGPGDMSSIREGLRALAAELI